MPAARVDMRFPHIVHFNFDVWVSSAPWQARLGPGEQAGQFRVFPWDSGFSLCIKYRTYELLSILTGYQLAPVGALNLSIPCHDC